MPNNLLNADTGFPKLNDSSTDEKIEQVVNYLFMLLEQLRYTLSNLGEDNFNDTELTNIAAVITDPVYLQLRYDEANIATLTQTVNGLSLSVSNGLNSSTIRLMANGIAVSSQSISFTGTVTFLDLQETGMTEINGDNITTGTIQAIDIEGCTITGSTFRSILHQEGDVGGELEMYYLNTSYLAGGIRLDDNGAGTPEERTYRMFIYTEYVAGVGFAMKLQSASGMSLEAQENIYINAGTDITIQSSGDIYLYGTAVYVNDTEIGI